MRKFMTLATLSLLCFSAAAQQIYQWADEQGRPQFGQLPPADRSYQQLDIRAPAPIGGQLRAPAALPERDNHATTSQPPKSRQQQAAADELKSYCEQLERDLVTLQNNPRLRRTNADGEVERLGEDERQRLMQQVRDNVEQHCR